uniref:Thyroid adenoma-associated protein n=1 Tax=Brugia timori TaxID=42155 RepID=A0A0R3QXU0_9BILA
LSLQMKKELFAYIIQSSIAVHREGLLIWYLKAMASVAESSVIEKLEKEHCTYLWKFTLSLLQSQSQNVSEFAIHLLHKIIIPCTLFDMSRSIDETAVRGWTFRCAILKFILKTSVKPANVPINAVLEILCFKPDFHHESPESNIGKLERYLMNLFSIPVSETSHQVAGKKYFVHELVEFVGNNFMQLWKNIKLENTDTETLQRNQISLFLTVQNFFYYFRIYDAYCDPLLSVLQVMSVDLPRIIRNDKLTDVDEWLLPLGVRGSWQAADEKLRNTICLKLKQILLQQLIDVKCRFADKKDWNKELSGRIDAASDIVSTYVSEAVRCCNSFSEAVFIVEPFIQHGTVVERRKFITTLRTIALTAMLQGEEEKSERNVNELIITELILAYLPVEDWKFYGVLFNNLATLHKCLHCSVWLDQSGLAKFVMSVDLPDEFRASVVKNIYMPPLKHRIHLRILAFLISMGTSYLYKINDFIDLQHLIRIFPSFDAIIDLFLEAAAICYEVQPSPNNGFLPADDLKRFEVIRAISANRQPFQRYVNAEEVNTSHMMYLDILFLVQEKTLSELFDRLDFKKSFAAAITMNLCSFFVKLRKLLRFCRFLGYEFLIFRALKSFLKCDLSTCSISMKLFIIENCATLCSLAARSCLASAWTESITYLLQSWFDLYDLLLELHYDMAMEKLYCVFDVFIDDSDCKEQIMARINMKIFEKNHFRIEHLLKETLGRFNFLLCKTYWKWLYENFGKLDDQG